MPPAAMIVRTISRSDPSSRATNITRAPCPAAIRAVARPIPELAPVRTITWSAKGLAMAATVIFS
ncbi:hypothetical protein MOP88_15955 [Sphingomonas sp. WKB10]|nr:hypothetical protein [Sphingomonas sp. WKB10]